MMIYFLYRSNSSLVAWSVLFLHVFSSVNRPCKIDVWLPAWACFSDSFDFPLACFSREIPYPRPSSGTFSEARLPSLCGEPVLCCLIPRTYIEPFWIPLAPKEKQNYEVCLERVFTRLAGVGLERLGEEARHRRLVMVFLKHHT